MRNTVLFLMIISLFSKAIGFLREILLSYFYGTSEVSDAYLTALIIPTVIFTFIGAALSTSFIPIYNEILKKDSLVSANKFMNNLITTFFVISILLATLGALNAQLLVNLFASGLTSKANDLAVTFTQISIFGIIFTLSVEIMRNFLQIKGNYSTPALVGIPMNLILLITISGSYYFDNLILLPIGILLSIIAQIFFLIGPIKKVNFSLKPVLDLKDKYLKKIIVLSLPVLIGVAVNDINKIVDKTLASQVGVGGISALNYAISLNNFVQGVFIITITAKLYPIISKMFIDDELTKMKMKIEESILQISLTVIPISLIVMIFSDEYVSLLFGRGQFDQKSISMTSQVLFYYSLGMLFYGLREILSKPFYAAQNTRIPMLNAFLGVGINIILSLVLIQHMGLGGIALATSISSIITTVLMYISFKKKFGDLNLKLLLRNISKVFCFSIVTLIVMIYSYKILLKIINNADLIIILCTLFSSIFYLILILIFKIDKINFQIKRR